MGRIERGVGVQLLGGLKVGQSNLVLSGEELRHCGVVISLGQHSVLCRVRAETEIETLFRGNRRAPDLILLQLRHRILQFACAVVEDWQLDFLRPIEEQVSDLFRCLCSQLFAKPFLLLGFVRPARAVRYKLALEGIFRTERCGRVDTMDARDGPVCEVDDLNRRTDIAAAERRACGTEDCRDRCPTCAQVARTAVDG